MADLKLSYDVYIRATPEDLWDALTNPERTVFVNFGAAVESDWKPGSRIAYRTNGGKGDVSVQGTLLAVERPVRLAHTWDEVWNPESRQDPPSRVTYEIRPLGEVCKLTITHEGFERETRTYRLVGPAWPMFLSALKTLLETGQPLAIPRGG